jgi:transporter family-2 protein
MDTVLVIGLIGLVGGIAVGLQAPLINMIGLRLGIMESVFIAHLGGAIFSAIPLLIARGGNLMQWRSVPWYALIAGLFGLVITVAINITIPRLGATTTIVLVVVGQLIIGMVIDHFGLLDTTVRVFTPSRLVGIVVLLLGTYLIMR